MSGRSLLALALGCALGSGTTLVVLRSDLARNPAPAAAPGDPRAPSDEEIGPRVAEILEREDPLGRLAELGALLAALGPSAASALVEAFEAAPLDAGDPELVLLGMWWARLDPQAAFDWTASDWRARSGPVIAAVLRSAAHSDARLALATAQGLTFQSHRQLAIEAAVAGWDESGQPGLLEAIAKFPDLQLQRLANGLARRRVVTLGPAEAFQWVESLETAPRLQQLLGQRVASTAAESAEGAPLAAAWATPRVRSDDRQSNFPSRIATRWVVHDPEAAMAWLATLPAGADRNDGVVEAFRSWRRRSPRAAAAWIEAAELQPWNEPALGLYLRTIAGERPAEAIEQAQRIGDAELRTTTMIRIARAWVGVDREAAEAWLARPGVPERVRRAAQSAARREPAREHRRRGGAGRAGMAGSLGD